MPDSAETVIELDRKRMLAMEARDYAFLETVLSDDLVYVHSSASVQTKTSLLSNMKSGSTVYASLEASHVNAQDLGAVVVLTGIAKARGMVNGAPLSYSVRFIDTYAWRDNRWQMVAWQSTRLP
jgi:hypothetical protein